LLNYQINLAEANMKLTLPAVSTRYFFAEAKDKKQRINSFENQLFLILEKIALTFGKKNYFGII